MKDVLVKLYFLMIDINNAVMIAIKKSHPKRDGFLTKLYLKN